MRPIPRAFLTIFLTLALLALRTTPAAAAQVIATGEICLENGPTTGCGTIQLMVDPAGGPVTGTYSYYAVVESVGVRMDSSGTLTGALESERVAGQASQQNRYSFVGSGSGTPSGPPSHAGTWEGTLSPDGRGQGTITVSTNYNGRTYTWSGTWSVTFSAQSASTATAPAEIALLPQAEAFIASSPTLEEATAQIAGQDAVIIARNPGGGYYAVNNGGQQVSLPGSLSDSFAIGNQFAIIGNNNLLASSEHGSIRGSWNGGGDFVMLNKIPENLRNRDFETLTTTCGPSAVSGRPARGAHLLLAGEFETCRPVMRVNSPASSIKVAGGALQSQDPNAGSSEHGSIRGGINGGGDFIFSRPVDSLASFRGTGLQPEPARVYLGVQAREDAAGAEILLVHADSPAGRAGVLAGDHALSVDGVPVDPQNPLAAALARYAPGDRVELRIDRAGQQLTVAVTLSELIDPLILTPSAEIEIDSDSVIVIDVGFNGGTAVLVLSGRALVREAVTGSTIVIFPGELVLVTPGNEIGAPLTVTEVDVNAWWESGAAAPDPAPTGSHPPDDLTSEDWMIFGGLVLTCLCVVGLLIGAILFFVLRGRKRRGAAR